MKKYLRHVLMRHYRTEVTALAAVRGCNKALAHGGGHLRQCLNPMQPKPSCLITLSVAEERRSEQQTLPVELASECGPFACPCVVASEGVPLSDSSVVTSIVRERPAYKAALPVHCYTYCTPCPLCARLSLSPQLLAMRLTTDPCPSQAQPASCSKILEHAWLRTHGSSSNRPQAGRPHHHVLRCFCVHLRVCMLQLAAAQE